MNKANNPIGFFDSGVGGITVWQEMIKILPNENSIYLADSVNAPYGKKSKEEIIALSEKNTAYLLGMNCKLIVVACNTATTNAIKYLRAKYAVPFVGIEPAIKPAALQTKTKSIGILATQGTLSSALFAQTSGTFAKDVQVYEQVGKGLVELIESGDSNSKEIDELLVTYLEPMLKMNIDHLILGCTHYPFLVSKIKRIVGREVRIIDSGYAVSKQIKNILQLNNLLNTQEKQVKYQFHTNKDKALLTYILKNIEFPISIEKTMF